MTVELPQEEGGMGAVCSDEQDPTKEPTEGSSEERSEEWRKNLLQNVDKIFLGRFPGRMIVFGKNAEPGEK